MKKVFVFILFLILFLASMGIGYFYLNTRDDQKKSSKVDENLIEDNNVSNEYISTETHEEKISPNANLITTIYYEKCGHTLTEEQEVSKEIVNLDEESLKERYDDWRINYFSDKEIAIYKEVNETCPEHYIIGESDGMVNIYRLNEEGEEELYETTSIYLDYLPEKDQREIRNKIEIIGTRNLNELLENYD